MPERAIRDAGNEMIRKDGTLVCSDGGFYLGIVFVQSLEQLPL
ncbi:MAG: hypothetical protein ACLU9T_17835 [Blautia faecis]